MKVQFKTAQQLLGKVVRRTAPSKTGDYSFVRECVLIKEIQEHNIVVKTVNPAHIISIDRKAYDDDNWIEVSLHVGSVQVAEMWQYIRELEGKLKK